MSDESSIVFSDDPKGMHEFILQRSRHIAASKYFPLSVKLGFGVIFLTKIFIMILLLLLLLGYKLSYIAICLVSISYISTFLFILKMSKKTDQKLITCLYPIWEVYYILNQLIASLFGFFGVFQVL